MTSHGRSQKRSLEQRGCCASTTRYQNKRKTAQSFKEGENSESMRNWDELEQGILVIIMKFLVQRHGLYGRPMYRSWFQTVLRPPFLVCKSWMMAVLGSIFPGNVLDLRLFDDISTPDSGEWRDYLFFLKGGLNQPHPYTKLYFPDKIHLITLQQYLYIAQRLPGLKSVVQIRPVEQKVSHTLPVTLNKLVQYWPELEEVHCHAAMIPQLSLRCKDIRKMELWGRIGDDRAQGLVSHFPRLVHLSVESSILSPNALSIILDGRPNLAYLDTRHAFRIKGPILKSRVIVENVMEWNEDEIRQKAAGITTYLHCARKACSYCGLLYSSDTRPIELRRFSTKLIVREPIDR